MNFVTYGVDKGYFIVSDTGSRITYRHLSKSYKFTDPEEEVRSRYYLELIEKYGYTPDCIDVEVVVPRRTPSDFADIVVYRTPEKKQPYIVIECKKDGISESEFDQAVEQAFGNTNSLRAKYTGVVAGNTRRFFDVGGHAAAERIKNIVADIPIRYGRVQRYKYKKGDPNWDISPVDRDILVHTLKKCHDTLWDGGKMDSTEAFDELCKFIFVKMQDELAPRKKGGPYDFQIKTNETAGSVFGRINKFYENAKNDDPEVFSDSLGSSPEKTLSIVNHLQGMSLSKTDLDTKGVAFESFMEDFFKGKQGQYFTPREIVRFIVATCKVNRRSLVLDPACGSGGFLLYILDYLREKASEYARSETMEHYRYWHDFASNRLYGIEVNDRISRVAKMNMVIHDDGHTNIICHDALDSIDKLQQINPGFKKERFDFILTNPPFGATIKFSEKSYGNDYQLGRTTTGAIRKEQKSEILFLERCWQFLKPGTGHLAIILPDGILTNHTQGYVREFIRRKFEIKAIFSLPQVTFVHYGAGVKSSILILRKKYQSEKDFDYTIFSAIVENVGYDATGRSKRNDLPDLQTKYQKFLEGTSYSDDQLFVKKVSQFNRNRLDPFYYSPLFDKINDELAHGEYHLMPLKDVCVENGIVSGKTPAKKDYSGNSADAQIVKVSSLRRGRVNLTMVGHVKSNFESKRFLTNGDIVILSAAHQAEYLGRNPCIVDLSGKLIDGPGVLFVAELMRIRVNPKIMNPYYLLQLLCTKTYYRLVNREKRGQTSHIYPRDIKNVIVPVPEIEIQNQNADQYVDMYSEYAHHLRMADELVARSSRRFVTKFLPG